MRCSAGQIVMGIGFAVTVLSSSEGSSARDFWSKRNALRASAFEPNTRMQVLSSIHSKPSKFASKCLAYANILEVGRWDMGVPYSKMALSLHEESEHVCQGMYYSAHTLLKRTPCIHVYIIPTIHFVFVFALFIHTLKHFHSVSLLLTTSNMSLTFFTEPFYSLSDFDRLFDEAFNARTSNSNAVAQRSGHNENAASRPLRPR